MLLVAHRKEGTDNISLVRDGKVSRLLVLPNQELACPQYSPTGHIIFERGTPPSGIWAVPFSLATMRTTGEPFLVAARGMSPSVAPDGGLTYVSPPAQELEFCWVDRAGSVVQHLATLGIPMEGGGVFDLSPDGTRAVITMGSAADLWIYDFVRGSRIQLTKNPGLDVNGTLTPDGRSVVYQTFPNLGSPKLSDWTLMRVNADASGAPESLATGGLLTPSISADGRTIYYTHITSETGWTLESRPLEGPGGPVALTDGRQVAYAPRSSPDGRWVVYCQDEIQPSGNSQVVLMSLASGWRTVLGNGLWPKWNERGDRIYFVQRDDIMEVKVGPGETPRTEPPVKLFTRPQIELPMVFDWTPQFSVRGDRFLVLRPQDETRMTSIVFVQNWLSEFRKK
jgi:dipeptidyl aminopeptidase/acylaminoacyl peptidase